MGKLILYLIEIKTFRAFRHLQIPRLARVNFQPSLTTENWQSPPANLLRYAEYGPQSMQKHMVLFAFGVQGLPCLALPSRRLAKQAFPQGEAKRTELQKQKKRVFEVFLRYETKEGVGILDKTSVRRDFKSLLGNKNSSWC